MKYERKCACCESVIASEDYYEVDGKLYCFDCMTMCESCSTPHLKDSMIWANLSDGNQGYVCEECIEDEDNFFYCSHCEEYYPVSQRWGEFEGQYVCQVCGIEHYDVCQRCDNVIRRADAYFNSETDETLCFECYEESLNKLENVIENYSYKIEPTFLGNAPDNCYLGVELEVDNTSDKYDNELIYKAAVKLNEEYSDRLVLKHDGSLVRGFEITTDACSLDFHTNDFGWEEIMDICKRHTLRSENTSSCGLHCHISRKFFGETQEEQDLNIAKLMLLTSKFYNSHILKFSRRKDSDLRWCMKPDMNYDDYDTETTVVDKLKVCKSRGRYFAINVENYHTVEYRIFKGSLNFETFLASLQFVVEFSRCAKRISLADIPTITWRDIFVSLEEFPQLKAYLKRKELI